MRIKGAHSQGLQEGNGSFGLLPATQKARAPKGLQIGQGHVVHKAVNQDESFLFTIFGEKSDACPHCVVGTRNPHGPAEYFNASRDVGISTDDSTSHFRTARAHETEHTDDLAATDGKADIFKMRRTTK